MNATYAAAERAIGEQRLRDAEAEGNALKEHHIAAAHGRGYGLAVRDLESVTVNLRAFSRGMVSREALPRYIAQAREALDRAEAALS